MNKELKKWQANKVPTRLSTPLPTSTWPQKTKSEYELNKAEQRI